MLADRKQRRLIHPAAHTPGLALDPRAPILVPMRAPNAPEPRVTLSARVLDGALRKHVVIIGQEKRDAFENAQHLSTHDAPIKSVLTGADVHWAP